MLAVFLELEKKFWEAMKNHDLETAAALLAFFPALYGVHEIGFGHKLILLENSDGTEKSCDINKPCARQS